MSISLHVLYDELDNAAIDRCYQWLRRNRPPYVNVTGAARFTQAIDYAKKIHREIGIDVILRNSGASDGHSSIKTDDGIHTRMSPIDWYNMHGKPFMGSGLILMTDNESVRDDMSVYARWMSEVMDLAGADGVRVAVGATATGNPAEHHYAQMDAMWRGLDKWDGLHIYRPHEYFTLTPSKSTGHIGRYRLAWQRCDQLHIPHPTTVIGEYGLLVGYDPEFGWRRQRLSGLDYAHMCRSTHDMNYAADGITVCTYDFGGNSGRWRDCNVDDHDWLNSIEEYNHMLITIDPFPTNDPDMLADIRLPAGTAFVNLRAQPDAKSEDLGNLCDGQTVHGWQGVKAAGWLPIELINKRRGWISGAIATFENVTDLTAAPPIDVAELKAARELLGEVILKASAAAAKLDEWLDQ